MTAACAIGQFVIGARLHDLRVKLGRPIDQVAPDNPLRIAFNDLHGYSVIILMTAMIAAIIAFFTFTSNARNDKYR